LSGAIAKPASINLQKLVLSPTGLINLGFILREDLLLCSSYLPLGVPNWVPNMHYHGHVYMLVAVDKFTKWIEASLVTMQDSTTAINFIKSIVFRFKVRHNIIMDNGINFTSKELKNYCKSMGIKLKFAFVAHPQMNGQVEKANGLICNGIKKRLLEPLKKTKHA
jgi:hypothetical protein